LTQEYHSLGPWQSAWTESTPVSVAGLKELAGFKSLQALDLAGANETDPGLKELAALKSLQALSLL
jgi:hypothetical protein